MPCGLRRKKRSGSRRERLLRCVTCFEGEKRTILEPDLRHQPRQPSPLDGRATSQTKARVDGSYIAKKVLGLEGFVKLIPLEWAFRISLQKVFK